MTQPALATTTANGRTYTWPPTGEEFPSVTTVLNVLAKPWLKRWAAKMVAERAVELIDTLPELVRVDPKGVIDMLKGAPDRKRDAAGDKGDEVHAVIEAHITGAPIPEYGEVAKPYLRGARMFLDDHPEFTYTHVERTFYSRTHGYAGSADFIAAVSRGGRTIVTLGDWKTSNSLSTDVALQLAAYRYADFMAGRDEAGDYIEEPVPPIEETVAVHIQPDAYECRYVDTSEPVFAKFLAARQLYDWERSLSKTVLGARLISPKVQKQNERLLQSGGL